jgi:endoglycosylceramidase
LVLRSTETHQAIEGFKLRGIRPILILVVKLVLRSSVALVALACVLIAGPAMAGAAGLKPIHASHGKHAAIVDGNGRQVTLRAMNVSSLQDNYQANKSLAGAPTLTNTDLARMRGLGINAIRLVINWSALEPQRGRLSSAYVSKIKQTISRAASYGMYTVVDMHNDGWSKYVFTHRGAKCPKGLRPTHGWDGAPKWATFTNGKTTCIASEGKRSAAVKAAWTNFWRNRNGIQKAYSKTWGKLAGVLAKQRAVAGFDILNAPDGGGINRHNLIHIMDRFNKKTIKAIRRAEKRRHGRKHIVFFEPNITWRSSGLKLGSPTPGFTRDRNIAFAPHLYGGVSHADPSPAQFRRKLKKEARQIAKRAAQYKAPVWLGEWGVDIGPNATTQAGIQRSVQEQHHWGGAWWQWEISCGNPHLFEGPFDPDPKPFSGTLNPVECPAGTPLSPPTSLYRALSHPTPRAVPGKLRTLHTRTNGITLTGKKRKCGKRAGACTLVVWSQKKMHVSGRHLKRVKTTQVPGGSLTSAQVRGRYKFVGTG